jgi:hypothetical protein
MRSVWNKWKEKWSIESDKRMLWIFVIFGITGTSVTFVRKPATEYLFQKSTYGELNWYEWIITLVIVYIIYQFILFVVGSLLGEHKFVKWFLWKMNKRILPFKSK